MRTGNIMIGAVKSLKIGDKVKISKSFGGGSGIIENFNGDFAIVKTRKGYASYGKSLLTKKSINGIGAASDAAYVEYTEKGKKNRLYFSNKIEAMQYVNRLLKTIKKGVYSEVVSSIKIKNAVN
jgi:hypothetical protein